MAAPGKRPGWGSFLTQAVAGVEARLDTILSEEDQAAARDHKPPPPSRSPAPTSPRKSSPAPSRAASTNRANDRLQERLARAMAAKSAAQKSESSSVRPSTSSHASPRQSLDTPPDRLSAEGADQLSHTAQSADSRPSSRPSSQELVRKSEERPGRSPRGSAEVSNGAGDADHPLQDSDGQLSPSSTTQPVPAADGDGDTPDRTHTPAGLEEPAPSVTDAGGGEEGGKVRELQNALEEAVLQHQAEIHGYVERIDALESKLQFLARETGDSSRKAALDAPAGSAERKLAEKDQQIAQLMEEGKNLAGTEHKQRTLIKKLRSKISDNEKESNKLRESHEKTSKELDSTRKRARHADELERTVQGLQRRLDQSQKELGSLRPELSSKDATIATLKTKLQNASDRADEAKARANDQAREQDQKRIAELEESVAALEVEKNLVADRAKNQANELKEKAERANERSRALELEMKAEVQVMESKVEAMRIRAEEASSGTVGDAQAKLLRQVETLQTQYSIASGNWQGIESTLLARIVNLEKERDEALHRESEMRKKAREASLRAKRIEEDLEETKSSLPRMWDDAKTYQSQIDSLKKRVEQAEAALSEAKAEADKHRNALKAEREERQDRGADHDRRGWLDDLPNAPFKSASRPQSPLLAPPQRTFSSEFLGLDSLPAKFRKPSAPSSNSGAVERAFSRHPSIQPPSKPSLHGGTSAHPSSPSGAVSDSLPTPVPRQIDREDAFENVETSSSSHQVVQDMVSVSTVAAGPSVQLVERMSAAIRRLESEKVAAREELARISNQRDEARAEILALMREVESGKTATQRVDELQAEIAEVTERYETTLELLGEKSELVEELRADVEDVKAMYRDLVESTVK